MFSVLVAMRLALAAPPASAQKHRSMLLLQGIPYGTMTARVVGVLAAFVLALLLLASSGQAGPQYLVALSGYDAVAYQTQGEAIQGRNEHAFFWNGATWLFGSESNRDAFAANPDDFAPRYDGYCAYAASQGYKAPGSPLAWRVTDGKLYVNFSQRALELWLEDVPGHIAAADRNWPKLNGN